MFCVRTESGGNIGRSMVARFDGSHDPGTTKFWFSAENANSRVEVVRNGSAEGILPALPRKKPFCSPSCPMTDVMPPIKLASPLLPMSVETSCSVPRTRSVKVEASAIASSYVVVGKVYWQGCIGGVLKCESAPFAFNACNSSCARMAVTAATAELRDELD